LWSTGYSAHCACEPASTAPGVSWGSGKGGVGRVVGWARCWVLRKRARAWVPLDCGTKSPSSWLGGGVWWARLFFENCTVDASISGERLRAFLGSWLFVCDLF